MKLKYTLEDAAGGKPVPREAAELLAEIQPHLNGAKGSKCRLLFFGLKFSKVLAEFEVCDSQGRALTAWFAKSYDAEVAARTFETLSKLAAAGFCPPARFTVTRPLVHLEQRHVLVVEKAPGTQFTRILFDGAGDSAEAATAAARWLVELHRTQVDAAGRRFDLKAQLHRFCGELAAVLPQHAERLRTLEQQVLAALEREPQAAVPSHRDFHPDNIFIAPDGRVTLIDLDQFGKQEPAGDVAYCMAQMAIMSYLRTSQFDATAAPRELFLETYRRKAAPVDSRRLAWHFAIAFIKSLHYELCVFHTNNKRIVEPWLAAAEGSLASGQITLPARAADSAETSANPTTRAVG